MHTSMRLALAGAVIALLTSPAPAQTAPGAPATPAPATSPATTTTTTTATGTTTAPGTMAAPGTAAGQPSFGELIASLNNMSGEVAKVRSMNGTSTTNIQPVNVAQLNGANPSALSSALTRKRTQLDSLRTALTSTQATYMNQHLTVAQFLADNKIALNQVVAADINNGKLLIFYQKP